jgi:xanthine dehydrogenase/oxidase
METFASDWTAADEERRMKCVGEEALAAVIPATRPSIPLPPGGGTVPQPIRLDSAGKSWARPASLAELGAVLREFSGQRVRMVNGNTAFGVYPAEVSAAEVLIDLQLVP